MARLYRRHVEFVHGDLEGEKGRRGLCQEDHCSAILRRLRIRTVEVTISIAHDTQSVEAQRCSRDNETKLEGQMGGSPKASLTASGRRNQPAGETQNIMLHHEKYDHLDGSGYDVPRVFQQGCHRTVRRIG